MSELSRKYLLDFPDSINVEVDSPRLFQSECIIDSRSTMAGFEDFGPKTQAWNLAPASSILFQFQIFDNIAHNPRFFERLEQECLEKEWK